MGQSGLADALPTLPQHRVNLGLGGMLLALYRPASPWRIVRHRGQVILLHGEDGHWAIALPGDL